MKFSSVWDSLEKENRHLKMLSAALVVLSVSLSIAVMSTASQAPLIVERGTESRVLNPQPEKPTEEEMIAFGFEALPARFSTREGNIELLSLRQREYRAGEQEELLKQKMKQVIIVNSISVEKTGLRVDADRLISIGDIRSTLRFPLRVELERTRRTVSNPYGLVISEVDQIKPEVKK